MQRLLLCLLLLSSWACSGPEPEAPQPDEQPQPNSADSIAPGIEMLNFQDRVAAGKSLNMQVLLNDETALDTFHAHLENINREFAAGRLKHNKVGAQWDTTLAISGKRQELGFQVPIDSQAFAGPYLMQLETKDRAGNLTIEDQWITKVTNPQMPTFSVDFEGSPIFPDLRQGQSFQVSIHGQDPDADLFRFYIKAPRGPHQHVHHGSSGELGDSTEVFAFDRHTIDIPWELAGNYQTQQTLRIDPDAPPGDYRIVFLAQDWSFNYNYKIFGFHVLEEEQ